MKIKRLHVNGFGTFHDFDPGEMGKGLTIFEGQNEAGKSTLMAFIRAVLLGFPNGKGKGARFEKYEPLSGGTYGGSIILVDDHGMEYRVQRKPGRSGGQVTVYLPDGSQEGEAFLQRLLGGISPILFKQIFAFSLTELQQLDFLENEEISSYIYSAGMGTGVPVLDVDKKLDGAMNALFKPRASSPKLNVLSAKLRELEKEISKLQQSASHYNVLIQEEKELEETIGKAEVELEGYRKKIAWLEVLQKGRESWESLVDLRFRLQHLVDTEDFPIEGLSRLERIIEEKRAVEIGIKQRQDKIAKCIEEMGTLQWNPTFSIEKSTIESLMRNEGRVKEAQQRQIENRMVMRETEERLQQILQQMGTGLTPEDLAMMDTSVGQRERVRFFRDRLQEAGKERLKLESHREQIKKELHKQRSQWVSLQREAPTAVFEKLETDIQVKEKALREIEGLRNSIEGVQREEAFLKEQHSDLKDRLASLEQQGKQDGQGKNPRWLVYVVLVAGLILALMAGLKNFLSGLMILFLTGTMVYWMLREKKGMDFYGWVKQEQHKIIEKIRGIQSRLNNLEEERNRLHFLLQEKGKKLRLSSLSLPSIARAEEDLKMKRREWERLNRVRDKIKECVAVIADLEGDLRTLEQSEREGIWEEAVKKEWQDWLSSRKLDKGLSPEGVMDFFRLIESGREIFARLSHAQEEYKTDETFVRSFSHKVAQLYQGLNLKDFSSEDPLSSFYQLYKRMEEEEEKERQWKQREKEKEVLVEERESLVLNRTAFLQEEAELFRRACVEDEEDFRRKAEVDRLRRNLSQEKEQKESALLLLIGTEEKQRDFEEALMTNDPLTIQDHLDKFLKTSLEYQQQLNQWRERKGELREQINRLEKEGTLSGLLQQREETLTELKKEGKKWGVYAICRQWLKEAREKYERERQPGVLREASHYFSKITEEKYIRILAPLGSETLYVVNEKGEHIEPGFLSRGTREQLYLSMRFALAREFSRQVTLPLIMDDIFVNFDLDRLQKTVETLGEMAKHHQIFFFTCHPAVSEILLAQIKDSKRIRIGTPVIIEK